MTATPSAMTYADYLDLPAVLGAQHPISDHHDELLFIVIHQTKELWLKQMLHEVRLATQLIRDDHFAYAHKALSRVSRIQTVMTLSWDVLSTLTPFDYMQFRHVLGTSSGFQSAQFRELEFRLGIKDERYLKLNEGGAEGRELLERALAEPSLWDEAVAALGRAGFDVSSEAAIKDGWLSVYRDADHWFDLASVSKVIATTTMILTLAEQDRLNLDRPLADAIPDLRQYDVANAAERRITFRDCLSHRTFLPAVEPLYSYGQDPATLRAFVLQREWRQGPPVYSDINYILLGIAVERLTGASLRDWSLPPGLSYGPPPGPAVATEHCMWRDRVLKGEVHDENAFALGGAPGHAGLFGTVAGVLGYAQSLLDGSASPFLLDAIRSRVTDHRTCGWERRFDGWPGGQACSDETIGHTGFTGTGLWVDFARGLAWTLLTNRVHPSRHKETQIMDLRRATGDAVIASA